MAENNVKDKDTKAQAKKPEAKASETKKPAAEKKPAVTKKTAAAATKKAPAKKAEAPAAEKPATKKPALETPEKKEVPASAPKAKSSKKYKIELTRSLAGRHDKHIATAISLGLKKIGDTTIQPDNEPTQGKIAQISYMINVTEA